jgi:hypothetical protein
MQDVLLKHENHNNYLSMFNCRSLALLTSIGCSLLTYSVVLTLALNSYISPVPNRHSFGMHITPETANVLAPLILMTLNDFACVVLRVP